MSEPNHAEQIRRLDNIIRLGTLPKWICPQPLHESIQVILRSISYRGRFVPAHRKHGQIQYGKGLNLMSFSKTIEQAFTQHGNP